MSSKLHAITATNARMLSAFKSPPNVVVVGGTAGIGRAIAVAVAHHCPSAAVTIIGRNQSAADAILPQLGANSKFLRADVSLMSNIRAVTQKIDAVDMLVLTQGIATMKGRTPTAENIDNKLALHYYGRVLFVQELLPLLRASPNGGKVLFVLDGKNGNPSKINWNDMALEQTYSLWAAACHPSTFTDLVIQHFASQPENANVAFTHACPGGVRTHIVDNLPFWVRLLVKGVSAVGLRVSPEDCAEYMLRGMLETDNGWRCVDNKGEPVSKKTLASEDMVAKVWEHTARLISSGR